MPRYLKVSDIPAIFDSLQGNPVAIFQLDEWQKKWVVEHNEPQPGAAVLSYRWRNRGSRETVEDFITWVAVG